jgi:D-alanine-D-alanine ligase
MGGNSAERDISINSGEQIYKALKNQNIDCFKFIWTDDNLNDLWQLKFDKVFIILHGRGGEDGYIQKQLEKRNIKYTGSDSIASAKCIDKSITKTIFNANKLPTPAAVLADANLPIPKINFPLPWAIKPILEGSSFGISKVEKYSQLKAALKLAWKYDKKALVEMWIDGSEYTVSILNGNALPVIKIVVENGIYDYQAKYHSKTTKYICPCGLSKLDEKKLQKIALDAFNAVGAKTWGRVDTIIADDKIYLLEINTIPGMTPHSLLPTAAKSINLNFEDIVLEILNG